MIDIIAYVFAPIPLQKNEEEEFMMKELLFRSSIKSDINPSREIIEPSHQLQNYTAFAPSIDISVDGSSLDEALSKLKQEIIKELNSIIQKGEAIDWEYISEVLPLNATHPYTEHHISINPSDFSLETIRFNVSWPNHILREVDNCISKTALTRSSFLAKAALKEISSYTNDPNADNPFINTAPMKFTLHRMDYFLSKISKANEAYEFNKGIINDQIFNENLMSNHIMFKIFFYAAQRFENDESYNEYIKILNKYHRPSGLTICGASILQKIPVYSNLLNALDNAKI